MAYSLKTALSVSILLLIFTASASGEPIEGIISRGEAQVGTPYKSGGVAPGGFDCSGFVTWLYQPSLPDFPRISRDQAQTGTAVPFGKWRLGDLLFYATGADPSQINHVAVWIGDRRIIHSISAGPETGVVITSADSQYWSKRYITARRVLPQEAPDSVPSQSPYTGKPDTAGVNPEETTLPAEPSPWDSFDGILEGDFNLWLKADHEAFESYKKENG